MVSNTFPSLTSIILCDMFVSQGGDNMAKYTLESIMCGERYNIESDVFIEVYKMAEQGVKVREIKEQINMLYVKHALLTAKRMQDEGDCISDDGITIAF